MTDKTTKMLVKLSQKDLKRIGAAIEKIAALEPEGLDVKTLKGQIGTFRVRVGSYRIVFTINRNKKPNIISIGRRSESTYKDL